MKAGIYVVRNKFKEEKYIVSLNGKEPFIRITNVILLSSFANGKLEKDHKVIQEMLNDPDNFEFIEFSKEIEQEPIKYQKKIVISDEEYEGFITNENILDDGNLNEILVKSKIQAKLHISWEEAIELFEVINNRFLTEDKWKILEKSSMSEANSVIQ